MKINKFQNQNFGTLTTITSEKTGIVMFLASEVGQMWGHTNMTQVIKRLLNKEEFLKVSKNKYPSFFNELATNILLSAKVQHLQLITESGLYKLALASNLDKAKPFRDWVASEVLPSIRKDGYYTLANQTEKIMIHANTLIQKQNSKEINKKNFIETGLSSVIDYNQKSCLLHSGLSTKEVKKIGKESGLKSNECNSAKEVLRHLKPEIACGMSFTDSLVSKGFDLNTISELSKKCAIPLFQGMIELGINPKELE